MSELTDHLSRIARVIDVPLIADADTGFGELTNTARAVREYERAGVAAVQIEDQVFPKRCGHMEGKKVIPTEKMVEKVRAALAARSNPDTVIIARTDAIAVTGLDDAIDRMKAYEAAGADVIFPDAPTSTADMSTNSRRDRFAARCKHVGARQDAAPLARRDRRAGLRHRAVPIVNVVRCCSVGARGSTRARSRGHDPREPRPADRVWAS